MSNLVFEQIDLSTPEAIVTYEQSFYRAFQRVKRQHLIRKLWQWDDQQGRLTTRIPYPDQIFYAIRTDASELNTVLAVNVRLDQFQSAAYGFLPPQSGEQYCEILTFFAVGDRDRLITPRFWRWCQQQLKAEGFETAYATSAKHMVKVYQWIGGEVIEETVIEGEARYFFKFDLG